MKSNPSWQPMTLPGGKLHWLSTTTFSACYCWDLELAKMDKNPTHCCTNTALNDRLLHCSIQFRCNASKYVCKQYNRWGSLEWVFSCPCTILKVHLLYKEGKNSLPAFQFPESVTLLWLVFGCYITVVQLTITLANGTNWAEIPKKCFPFYRQPMQTIAPGDCLVLPMGSRDAPVYWPATFPVGLLSELAEGLLEMVLETARLIVLGASFPF